MRIRRRKSARTERGAAGISASAADATERRSRTNNEACTPGSVRIQRGRSGAGAAGYAPETKRMNVNGHGMSPWGVAFPVIAAMRRAASVIRRCRMQNAAGAHERRMGRDRRDSPAGRCEAGRCEGTGRGRLLGARFYEPPGCDWEDTTRKGDRQRLMDGISRRIRLSTVNSPETTHSARENDGSTVANVRISRGPPVHGACFRPPVFGKSGGTAPARIFLPQ